MIRLSALFVLLFSITVARACPFCGASGTTMTQEANMAAMILYGSPRNARLDPAKPLGTTDLVIEKVIKGHPILGDRKVVQLSKFIDTEQTQRMLVFFDVYKGELDDYRGMAFKADSSISKYLQGALSIKEKPVPERLSFFFQYLDDSDPEISEDALKEFAYSDYKDFRISAEKFPLDRVRKWLKDPGTPPSRLGLYGSMLGHCGTKRDVGLLRKIIDESKKRYSSAMDGVLAGLVMLEPKQGWDLVVETIKEPKNEFLLRYAALRTARFFWEFRPDIISKERVSEAVTYLIEHEDLTDLAIDDLRKWSYWKAGPKVLSLWGKPGFELPVVKRAIMRYMLRCPQKEFPEAAKFVAEQRQKNPDWVAEVESFLNAESSMPSPTTASK